MANFNQWTGIGRLVGDPEMRYIGSGAGVVKFRLAVNPNKRDAKPEDTLFIDIIAWEKLAETCNTYLKAGSEVFVQGRLVIRSFDDKDGNKRKATEVVINTMQMLGGGRSNGSNGDATGQTFQGSNEFDENESPF